MATSRAAIVADYQKKWDTLQVTRPGTVEAAAKRILVNMDAYKAVEAKTGIPAAFIGALHMRECDNNMRGCLHNGELIIGTGRKTRLVPRGRGPFDSWEVAALDALSIEGFVGMEDKSSGALCEAAERFNGLGYRNKGRPSPYVWAGSQFYSSGKYVRDGVYSAAAVDPQLGVAPVMKRVMELAPGKSFVGRVVAKRQEIKAKVKEAAPKTHTLKEFTDFLGLPTLSLYGMLMKAGEIVTDWRTLAIGAAGIGFYGWVQWLHFSAGNKPIRAADGDNANA